MLNDLRVSSFTSDLEDGSLVSLRVEIGSEPHALLPSVFNLAFGPTNAKGEIDDKAEIAHKDYSKVFSSILLAGLTYLTDHRDHYLGIDGSNNARAYLYYRFLQRNFGYLDQFFEMYGLKYCCLLSKKGKVTLYYDEKHREKDCGFKGESQTDREERHQAVECGPQRLLSA